MENTKSIGRECGSSCDILREGSQNLKAIKEKGEGFMLIQILLYVGSGVIFLWGVGHIIPTRSIVKDFGEISADNRRIITME
jgi:hypothetical protein